MGDLGTLEPLAGPARRAASELASVPSGVKDRALAAMADALVARSQEISIAHTNLLCTCQVDHAY